MKWKMVKIEDVCEINPHRPNGVLPNEFVTILPMACVSEDGRITSHSVIRNNEVKVGLTPFQLNDILVAKITPCFENGKGTIVKGINSFYGYGSTEFHVLRSGESIEPRYLFYLTRTTDFRKKGQKSMTGSAGQKRVPEFFLRTYSFPLPPVHIQQQIADTLDKADALRRKDQELLKKYDELAQAIFYDMFGDPVKNEKGWEVKSLDHFISSLTAGVSVNSSEEVFSDQKPSVLKTSSVYTGKFRAQEAKIIIANDIQRAKVNPRKNSIIISRMNTAELVGKSAYVDQDFNNLFLPDRLWLTVKSDNQHSVMWLSFVLSSKRFMENVKKISSGTSGSMKNISKKDFLKLKVIAPPFQLQKQFERNLVKLNKSITIHSKIEVNSEILFNSISIQAFS